MDTKRYEYVTVNVTLPDGVFSAEADVTIPSGEVERIGAVPNADPGEMIDVSVLKNNSEVLRPCNLRFSQPTSGGNFLDCLRPVSGIPSGQNVTVKLTALSDTRGASVVVQVLFVIAKPAY